MREIMVYLASPFDTSKHDVFQIHPCSIKLCNFLFFVSFPSVVDAVGLGILFDIISILFATKASDTHVHGSAVGLNLDMNIHKSGSETEFWG